MADTTDRLFTYWITTRSSLQKNKSKTKIMLTSPPACTTVSAGRQLNLSVSRIHPDPLHWSSTMHISFGEASDLNGFTQIRPPGLASQGAAISWSAQALA